MIVGLAVAVGGPQFRMRIRGAHRTHRYCFCVVKTRLHIVARADAGTAEGRNIDEAREDEDL